MRAIVSAPPRVRRGEVFEVKTLIAHPMETGQRTDNRGALIPQDILRRLVCRWGDEVVFDAQLHAAVAANPYVSFHVRAQASGSLSLIWEGDGGFRHTQSVAVQVVEG